ncbi:MAG: pirin-like C-terminal cupin domain-containing protein [Phormidesmis sp.]
MSNATSTIRNSELAETNPVGSASGRRLMRAIAAQAMSRGQAFQASHVGRGNLGDGIDPFLQIDHFFMREPTFPPHPHAGFSAVTYLFEDSEGAFTNRDTMSDGDAVLIQPGDLHWTQAGSGMVHEETPVEPGKVCHGLQMFVNLAAADKFSKPQAFHLDSADIPTFTGLKGQRVRVVAGEAFGLSSPLKTLKPVTVLDTFLPAGEQIEHTLLLGHSAFVWVIDGAGTFGSDRQALSANEAGLFEQAEGAAVAQAGSQGLHYVLFSGSPIGEPIVSQGPFVMNSSDQIQQVRASYLAGEMGVLN